MYPNNGPETQSSPKYPAISTGRLAQVANALQIVRSVIGNPRALSGVSDSQKEAAVFNGLHEGANQDAVLRSALVLAAEPKLLEKVRDTFGDQQSLVYNAKRNRNFYVAGDPEDIKAAVATFDKMFEQSIPSLQAVDKKVPGGVLKSEQVNQQDSSPANKPTQPAVGNAQTFTSNRPPVPARRQVHFADSPPVVTGNAPPKSTLGAVQPKVTDAPAKVGNSRPKVGNVPSSDLGQNLNGHPAPGNAQVIPPRPPWIGALGSNASNLVAENERNAKTSPPARGGIALIKSRLDLSKLTHEHK